MRVPLLCLALLALVLLAVSSAVADVNPFTNPSFESGFAGWGVYSGAGGVDVVTAFTGQTLGYTAPVGSYFLKVQAGDAGDFINASRIVALQAGDVVSGWAAFDSREPDGGYNDNAVVYLMNLNTGATWTPWSADVNGVGFQASSPWQHWSWTAPVATTYELNLGCANATDDSYPSVGLFDLDLTRQGPDPTVPEPGSLALVLMGLGPLGVWIRRKRQN